MTRIASPLEDLQQEIAKSHQKSSKNRQKVRLIAVSKRQSIEKIQDLAKQGQTEFAENQLQEALDKMTQLVDFPIKWHFIGSVQSRKCKAISEHFDWLQSLDRAKLVDKLEQARSGKKPLNVCIQVNLFGEMQKSGATETEAFKLAELVANTENLRLRGIMALPPKQTESQLQKQQFDEIKRFYDKLKAKYPQIDTISMGMSGDYQQAILAGSNMIRVGTKLFGERN